MGDEIMAAASTEVGSGCGALFVVDHDYFPRITVAADAATSRMQQEFFPLISNCFRSEIRLSASSVVRGCVPMRKISKP